MSFSLIFLVSLLIGSLPLFFKKDQGKTPDIVIVDRLILGLLLLMVVRSFYLEYLTDPDMFDGLEVLILGVPAVFFLSIAGFFTEISSRKKRGLALLHACWSVSFLTFICLMLWWLIEFVGESLK